MIIMKFLDRRSSYMMLILMLLLLLMMAMLMQILILKPLPLPATLLLLQLVMLMLCLILILILILVSSPVWSGLVWSCLDLTLFLLPLKLITLSARRDDTKG